MKLHYEVRKDKDGSEYCITPCPLGKKTMGIALIKIGSENCPHCKRYRADDLQNQILTCTCDQALTEDQINELRNKGIALD